MATLYHMSEISVPDMNIKASASGSITTTGADRQTNIQNIGTTYEAIVEDASIGTPGMAIFRNLDPTNYVEIGLEVAATFYPFLKLKPGDPPAIFRISGTLYARANTAAVDLDIVIIEE